MRKRKKILKEPWIETQKRQGAHDHKEAFCLMTYLCEQCGAREMFWNSRNGVTPFTCACRTCGGTMEHVDWQNDRFAPDYVPQTGQGVWIDMPEELKPVVARIRVTAAFGTPFDVAEPKRTEVIRAIAASFHEGEPWLIRWP